MRILIPTAGNRSVLIHAFRDQADVSCVVTTEIDALAPGSYFADRCYHVPRSASPGYLEAIEEIVRKERIDLLVPLADLDLVRFARERGRFTARGVTVWAAADETIELAMDKWQSYHLFRALDIPTPDTRLFSEALASATGLRFPLYLKPRHAGMKSSPRYLFSLLQDGADLEYFARKLRGQEQDYLVQESLLDGREINVDFFVQDCQLKRLVTLYRLKAGNGGGIIRGETIPCDPRLRSVVERLCARLDFRGAANIQAFALPDGRLLVTEINPRFSNSSALVVRPAGVDFYALTLRMARGEAISAEFDNYRMLRVTSAYQPFVVAENCFAA